MILFGLYFLVLLTLIIGALMLVNSARTRGSMARALNMSLFLVSLPRGSAAQNQKPEKDLISVMEQFYASLANLHAKGWNKFLHGEPYLAMELSVHHIGEEIHFYVAVPKSFGEIFEKQVHGLYPDAQVQPVKEYNIFNPQGTAAGAYLTQKGNPILPLKTYTTLQSDPLGIIATALSKLEKEGEGAAIQILIRPSHRDDIRKLAQKVAHQMQSGHDFKKALMLVQNDKKKTEEQKKKEALEPVVATAFEQETIKALQSKASRILFDTNIRMVVAAAEPIRAKQLLDELAGAFVQFGSPDVNSLKVNEVKGNALEQLIFNYVFRIFDNKQRLYLSSEEITSIYHLPLATTQAPRLKSLDTKFAQPPADLPQEGVILGKNLFRGQESVIRMTDEDRRRHMYVIGQTGTGKTTIMKNMIVQDIAAGKGVCLVDPHGEFAEYVLSMVPPERAGDVVYFNPGDIERPMGFNMLEIDPSKPEQKTFVANELLAIIKALYKDLPEAFGPMFEQYFKNAILLLLDDYGTQAPTIAEIPRVLADAEYRKDKLSRETNPLVKNFWEQEAEKAGGEASLANMVPYITSKLNPFLANDYVRPIISQQASAFNFRQIIDGQKILIVNLSKGRIGDINANLLGMIIVSKLLMSALSRIDMEESQRKDFYLYIDEFQNFTTESIATILAEARKYRLDLIIAHQFIKQLSENIKDAVFGNVGSMAVFRISAEDAEFLKNRFEPTFGVQDLINIHNFNAHLRLLIRNQVAPPFNIKVDREPAGNDQNKQQLAEMSRQNFGRPREEVEQEIKNRYIK